jgi:hypothetical protein
MTIGYGSNCEHGLRRYVSALTELDKLSDRVDKEYEDAPGRLRDAFEFFPQAFHLDETSMRALQHVSWQGREIIDQARNEMDKRKTKKVAVYLPSYRQDLRKAIVTAQKVILQEALTSTQECACPPKRGG